MRKWTKLMSVALAVAILSASPTVWAAQGFSADETAQLNARSASDLDHFAAGAEPNAVMYDEEIVWPVLIGVIAAVTVTVLIVAAA